MSRVRITLGALAVDAELGQSQTAGLILAALPLESTAQRWGDEVYFSVPVTAGEENPQAEVADGAVAYWPPGKALCLFFGQQPYSPVNVIGRLDGDPMILAQVPDGAQVRVDECKQNA